MAGRPLTRSLPRFKTVFLTSGDPRMSEVDVIVVLEGRDEFVATWLEFEELMRLLLATSAEFRFLGGGFGKLFALLSDSSATLGLEFEEMGGRSAVASTLPSKLSCLEADFRSTALSIVFSELNSESSDL